MALNPFFLQGSPGEQRLIQELINEQLKIYGVEVIYIPRKFVRRESIIEEVTSSKFDDNFGIEAYVNTYEGYSGAGDVLTKFGMSLRDELNLVISKERFEDFIGAFLNDIPDSEIGTSLRPKEGDIIYFPLGKRLFEVKFVEHEKPFYQLGKTYVYELQCELFEYQDEMGGWDNINTTTEEIDSQLEGFGYITTLQLISFGQQATGTATTSTGYIRRITLTNDGHDYTSVPTVSISTAPSGGTNATAVAITTSLLNTNSVKEILLTNAGAGYTETPTITISGGGGTGAAATCSIETEESGVVSLSIDQAGTGYPTAPIITIAPPVGPGAAATATVSAVNGVGKVTGTTITSGGNYYIPSSSPSVTFSDPTGGGNETDTVKFGSRAYDGGDSGTLIPTTGLSASDEGAVEFWFYIAQAPASGTSTIARWGSNDAGNEQYRLDIQTLNGNQIFYHRPSSDSSSGTTAITVTTTFADDLNGWNWIRISQASSGFNQVAVHYMGSSGSFQSTYSSQTFHTQIYNGDGFNLNPDGDFSDGEVFVDEVRFTSDGSNTQPTLPTSTSENLANTVFFNGGERVTATGTANVSSDGIVTGITITNGGLNYSSAPTVSIGNSAADKQLPTGFSTATAVTDISTSGIVTAIRITNPGYGYIQTPTVTIAEPPILTGIGTFVFNEVVTGSVSGARARVKSWDSDTNVLKVGITDGDFLPGDVIVGSASSARYSLDEMLEEKFADKYEQNDEIEEEADLILDFTENNPFGNY